MFILQEAAQQVGMGWIVAVMMVVAELLGRLPYRQRFSRDCESERIIYNQRCKNLFRTSNHVNQAIQIILIVIRMWTYTQPSISITKDDSGIEALFTEGPQRDFWNRK